MLYNIVVRNHKVFAMYAGSEHNTAMHVTNIGADEYYFENEDDAIAFEEEMIAYDAQQKFLDTCDDEALAALCIK